MNRMAETNLSKVNWSTGIGSGPTPLACTCSPQNGWSPKNGITVVGHYGAVRKAYEKEQQMHEFSSNVRKNAITAALRPAAVVPAPPW